jgi:ankyrin repeat protein
MFPLASYAARHWVGHAQFGSVASQIQEGMELLFDQDKPYFSAWLRVDDIDWDPVDDSGFYYFAEKSNTATPLYYAALCGFQSLTEQLMVHYPQHVNANGGNYISPLVVALERGHFKVAELLYQHGANVDVLGLCERTPLHAISGMGLFETLQWLLSHGADPNVCDGHSSLVCYTPLHMAASHGYLEETRILLQYGADSNTRDGDCQTSLHFAVSEGHPNVTRLLLEHGADANARDMNGSTPLHLASKNGTLEAVRLLVEHGADIDVEDNHGRTAFQTALARPEECHEITKFLSEHSSKKEHVLLS